MHVTLFGTSSGVPTKRRNFSATAFYFLEDDFDYFELSKAYIRRDYQAAYKLYCEAELVQELDTVSSRFKTLLMKRLVLVEKGS